MNRITLPGNKLMAFFVLLLLSTSLFSQNWQTDFEKSKQLAAKESKTIILVFQGSDWCAPCMKLEKEIWKSKEFMVYAKDHYVMLKADFPRKKANQLDDEQVIKNKKLAEKYNKSGFFPYVAILDKSGEVLGGTGYKKMSPKQYIQHLNSFIK